MMTNIPITYPWQTMITVVRSLQTIILHHAVVKGGLSVSTMGKLHVGASSLQAGGVGHELGGAHRLHLPEELHGAAGHILALTKTFPAERHQ